MGRLEINQLGGGVQCSLSKLRRYVEPK
ncbi:uncharacterized protein G2W53_019746 [Senna tora]|uniref:Uncharacterized protein n=1 Tax=Senna tora TaxID=362788 RepID=A0A834TWL5_9FABA|nr:uncharacterized protein G2W53_019746 [Senna tora]